MGRWHCELRAMRPCVVSTSSRKSTSISTYEDPRRKPTRKVCRFFWGERDTPLKILARSIKGLRECFFEFCFILLVDYLE